MKLQSVQNSKNCTKQKMILYQTKYYFVPNNARIIPIQTGHFAALLLPALAPYILAGPELFPFINQVIRFQIRFLKHMTNNSLIKGRKTLPPIFLQATSSFPSSIKYFVFIPDSSSTVRVIKVSKM